MRNTDQRVKAALLGAKKIKQKRQLRAVAAGATALSLGLIVLLSLNIPAVMCEGGDSAVTAGFAASVFANPQPLGYIIIGIFSFLLGVCVTALCVLLRKKQQEEGDGHDH